MLSLFSFLEGRKKAIDLSPYMRRICDLTTPNCSPSMEQSRLESRYNRTLPVLVCPWNDGQPRSEQATFAITKDLSDHGVSVVTSEPLEGQYTVGFALPNSEPREHWFFLGHTIQSKAIGGGFWTTGIELTEFASLNHRRDLEGLYRLAQELFHDATP